jgi:hypothetical protein
MKKVVLNGESGASKGLKAGRSLKAKLRLLQNMAEWRGRKDALPTRGKRTADLDDAQDLWDGCFGGGGMACRPGWIHHGIPIT